MTPNPYTEATLAQKPTVDYLEKELGWESIYAHNTETFGPPAPSTAPLAAKQS